MKKQQPKLCLHKKKWDFLNFIEKELHTTNNTPVNMYPRVVTTKSRLDVNTKPKVHKNTESAIINAISKASICNQSACTSLRPSPNKQECELKGKKLDKSMSRKNSKSILGNQMQVSKSKLNLSIVYKPPRLTTSTKSTINAHYTFSKTKHNVLKGVIDKAMEDREKRKECKSIIKNSSVTTSHAKAKSRLFKENIPQKSINKTKLMKDHNSISDKISMVLNENINPIIEGTDIDKLIAKYTAFDAKKAWNNIDDDTCGEDKIQLLFSDMKNKLN